MFQPHLEILPAPQRTLWPELCEIPRHFILYGGTALALRLGHRQSLDFDFFSSKIFAPEELLHGLRLLKDAKVLQNTSQTLTVAVSRGGRVKLSFFGGLPLGRVGEPEPTRDGQIQVASLLDLAGTKAAVITQRAESKDYIDLLAIVASGLSLPQAMGAALSIYGKQYNPLLTLKSLTYFGDGDLHKLTPKQKQQLIDLAATQAHSLPLVPRVSDTLSGGTDSPDGSTPQNSTEPDL
ncbi:conserved hypothetical protein [Verrucomicrobia bacterium]|nr:conserved hypothetical protein [Verrucomicrobiota bacterium]